MDEGPLIWVLRIGHRLLRDDRTTTHLGLVARALGADGMYIVGFDDGLKRRIDSVSERWGGDFQVVLTEGWRRLIRDWKMRGLVVHLTMYGMPLDDVIDQIRGSGKDVLVVVGSKKMPREVFDLADVNVSITNQPHSETAALAIFLDRFFRGMELTKEFKNARMRIIPQRRGKKLVRAPNKTIPLPH